MSFAFMDEIVAEYDKLKADHNRPAENNFDYFGEGYLAAYHKYKALTPPQPQAQDAREVEPVLPCALRVGGGTFHKGVSVATVQGSIDRIYTRLLKLEKPISDEDRAKWKSLVGFDVPPHPSGIYEWPEEERRKLVAVMEKIYPSGIPFQGASPLQRHELSDEEITVVAKAEFANWGIYPENDNDCLLFARKIIAASRAGKDGGE